MFCNALHADVANYITGGLPRAVRVGLRVQQLAFGLELATALHHIVSYRRYRNITTRSIAPLTQKQKSDSREVATAGTNSMGSYTQLPYPFFCDLEARTRFSVVVLTLSWSRIAWHR